MREITYAEAMVEALDEIMAGDARVSLIGSYFLGLSPRRVLLTRLQEKYPDRTFDPPISEAAYCGLGIGAAMAGERPIVDVATSSFLFQAFSQIANEAANAHYMSGGQIKVPVVFHILHGIRGGGAAQHSHSPQAMLWNTPGLQIVLPASPQDVKGLLKAAVASDNPTIFVDHVKLFELVGPVPDECPAIPLGKANVARAGADVTIVATSYMVQRALHAADRLAAEKIAVEVIDLRTLVPLDKETMLRSIARTGRVVIADEGHRSCGVGSELAALVAEEGFEYLKAPIRRVVTPDVPVPFSPPLEKHIDPDEDRIVAAVREVLK
ncbi:MAG: alpha-ketoacid dehydrogenase subunit beta [Burkholderiaceae bacterium]|nr:alpha-ketoacid dehydrogenase subunit beta [Burkholderiaceae bacterium]